MDWYRKNIEVLNQFLTICETKDYQTDYNCGNDLGYPELTKEENEQWRKLDISVTMKKRNKKSLHCFSLCKVTNKLFYSFSYTSNSKWKENISKLDNEIIKLLSFETREETVIRIRKILTNN